MHAQCGNGHIMNNESKNIKGEENSPRRKFTGKNYKKPKSKKTDLNRSLAFKEIEKKISSSLGANVKINDKGNKGSVSIEYYSGEELERILSILSK